MNYVEMVEGIEDAVAVKRRFESMIVRFLGIVSGNLRCAKDYSGRRRLCDLKRELKDFNAVTMKWKNEE
jgi:hypothetical protein